MANETHESGALLIFFSIENTAGRKFRLVVWPENHAGRMVVPEFEELKKDALGASAWVTVNVDDEPRHLHVIAAVLATVHHRGLTIPAQGIDLGMVKP